MSQSSDLALSIDYFEVYSAGVEFVLEGRVHPNAGNKRFNLGGYDMPGGPPRVRVTARFDDGRETSNAECSSSPTEVGLCLASDGSGRSGNRITARYFLTPLPRTGGIALDIRYPEYGISRETIHVEETDLSSAVRMVERLW